MPVKTDQEHTGVGLQLYSRLILEENPVGATSSTSTRSSERVHVAEDTLADDLEGVRPEPRWRYSRSEAPQLSTKTILLLEDVSSVRNLFVACLRRFGFNVIDTGSPATALRVAKNRHVVIDLLITDILLPFSNGRQVAEMIGSIRSSIKILYVSGYPRETLAHLGALPSTTENFLRKPFEMSTFRGAINRILFDRE